MVDQPHRDDGKQPAPAVDSYTLLRLTVIWPMPGLQMAGLLGASQRQWWKVRLRGTI
jgi:hypothetical protein